MNLASHYENIALRGMNAVLEGKERLDPWLKVPEQDTRMGLSLLIRIPLCNAYRLLETADPIKKAEPHQYYYPPEDLHITVMDLLQAKPNFTYTPELLQQYSQVLTHLLPTFSSFTIHFRGIIPSEDAILAKGYYDPQLEQLRQTIRHQLHQSGLPLEERYETKSCHTTFVRFVNPLSNRTLLLDNLGHLTESDLGKMTVTKLELTYHNWYDSVKTVFGEYYLG